MIPLNVISELYDYNYWARDQQFSVCRGLTRRQFNQQVDGSFPSIRQTVTHMALVEWVWRERWEGRAPDKMPGDHDLNTAEELQNYMLAEERRMREFLSGLDEPQLAKTISYVNFQGETWSYALWRMLVHLVNHQSYHRGQVTNFLRALGVKPPKVDFLVAHDTGFRVK